MVAISIHAPRVRCDLVTACCKGGIQIFQSTHLVWGATTMTEYAKNWVKISIHAPRVRCDEGEIDCLTVSQLFQSTHLVWGATRAIIVINIAIALFQSTHLVWGATSRWFICLKDCRYFNPRTSCEVRLLKVAMTYATESNFNPRTSCEVRHKTAINNAAWGVISIHAPRVRCD